MLPYNQYKDSKVNKKEFIEGLEKLGLDKAEYIILSGGSLLMRGLREKTSDYDLSPSKKLAEELDLKNCKTDAGGFYVPFENVQMKYDDENIPFDIVDGYKCESLESVLEFKRKKRREKDLKDIKVIEEYLKNQ